MSIPVIAIFDIGKTNKKFLLFDESYELVYETSERFEETADEDGDPCDDIEKLVSWLKKSFLSAFEDDKYEIKAVNFATYGASFVHIDEREKILTPLYNYLKKCPDNLIKQFQSKYDQNNQLYIDTSSPELGMINSGMQLYWLKHQKPELFDRIKYAVHFPQYLSFVLGKELFSEITSIGCHTLLWDFKKNEYASWVIQEGIDQKLPPITNSTESALVEFGNKKIHVGIGLHDSSSALIPYLYHIKESFALVSTGTWSISLCQDNNSALTKDELDKDCLCYMNYKGKPVKASRLFLGNAFDIYEKKIAKHFNKPADYFKSLPFEKDLAQNLIDKGNTNGAFFSLKIAGTGPYPKELERDIDFSQFKNYEDAYYQLNYDLAKIQASSILLAVGDCEIEQVCMSGGFCQNEHFINFLAAHLPRIGLYTSSLSRATALGAALVIHDYWNKKNVPKDLFELKLHTPLLNLHLGDN